MLNSQSIFTRRSGCVVYLFCYSVFCILLTYKITILKFFGSISQKHKNIISNVRFQSVFGLVSRDFLKFLCIFLFNKSSFDESAQYNEYFGWIDWHFFLNSLLIEWDRFFSFQQNHFVAPRMEIKIFLFQKKFNWFEKYMCNMFE